MSGITIEEISDEVPESTNLADNIEGIDLSDEEMIKLLQEIGSTPSAADLYAKNLSSKTMRQDDYSAFEYEIDYGFGSDAKYTPPNNHVRFDTPRSSLYERLGKSYINYESDEETTKSLDRAIEDIADRIGDTYETCKAIDTAVCDLSNAMLDLSKDAEITRDAARSMNIRIKALEDNVEGLKDTADKSLKILKTLQEWICHMRFPDEH